MKNVGKNKVIQFNQKVKNKSFLGLFAIVSEVKSWGVMCYISEPCDKGSSNAWYRANFEEFEVIGDAVLALKE